MIYMLFTVHVPGFKSSIAKYMDLRIYNKNWQSLCKGIRINRCSVMLKNINICELNYLRYSGKKIIWIILEIAYTYFIQCMHLICFYLDIKLFLIE